MATRSSDRRSELPAGWGVDTDAGRYRLVRRVDEAVFAHSAGPQSWKDTLHPARRRLLSAQRHADPDQTGFSIEPEPAEVAPRYAFLGVRPCDLAAIGILDRVLAGGAHPSPH